jgi:hypothetical protein
VLGDFCVRLGLGLPHLWRRNLHIPFALRRASDTSRLRRECDPGKVRRSEKADLVW